MMTIDEAWDLINALNDDAHGYAWDLWIESDEAEDEEEAETLREDASNAQAEYFRDLLNDLESDARDAIFHYAKTDEEFKDQFECYYGPIDED